MDDFNLVPLLPEIFMALTAMGLLIVGVFHGNEVTRVISWAAVGSVAIAVMLLLGLSWESVTVLNGMFIFDNFAGFTKLIILLGVIASLAPHIDCWQVAGLSGPRGLSGAALGEHLAACSLEYLVHVDVATAWATACRLAGPADTIAAFGSFHTVAEVMAFSTPNPHG